MPSDGRAVLALVAAAVVSGLATPLMAKVARSAGILDHPVGYKRHDGPTPYLGGLAILLGTIAASLPIAGVGAPVPAVVGCAAGICVLGTLDDWRPIPWSARIAVQAAIAGLLWIAGTGWDLDLPGWANCVLTIGWIVVATNAFNLIDNLDGTSAAAAAASAVGIVVIALDGSLVWPAVIAAAVLGAAAAFLPYNLSKPARIFLGDGGSTLVGFLLAVTAMAALPGESAPTGLIAAGLLLGAPVIDAAITLGARRRRGIPLLTGGRDHVTHRILRVVGSVRATAAIIAAAQLGLCGLAVAWIVSGLAGMAVAAAGLALAVSAGIFASRGAVVSAEPAAGLISALRSTDSMAPSTGIEPRAAGTAPRGKAQ
jgi:UDP-GlcNAc:undecaprenyl-phosphate GlcNAc-1-phosphate transferase